MRKICENDLVLRTIFENRMLRRDIENEVYDQLRLMSEDDGEFITGTLVDDDAYERRFAQAAIHVILRHARGHR